jgi:hypothetical protein
LVVELPVATRPSLPEVEVEVVVVGVVVVMSSPAIAVSIVSSLFAPVVLVEVEVVVVGVVIVTSTFESTPVATDISLPETT